MESIAAREQTGGVRRVPPGGPSAINGVLYQLLWSLFELSNAEIASAKKGIDGTIQKLTVILEPDGGGDLRFGRRVDQIKARPQQTTWSLKEIIQDVIPDLYAASRQAPAGSVYRFVTEGRMGNWGQAYQFFRSLGRSPEGPSRRRSDLDDTRTLFQPPPGTKFWKLERYTEKTLYDLILEQVRRPKAIRGESVPPQLEMEKVFCR